MAHSKNSPLVQKLIKEGRLKPEDMPKGIELDLPSLRPQEPKKMVKTMQFGRRKYRNQPCEVKGEKFDSKLEAKVYADLCAYYGKENVIRQVSIPLGKYRIRPDFMIIHDRGDDGTFTIEFADAKGRPTRDWEAKANHLQDKHRVGIRLIKK